MRSLPLPPACVTAGLLLGLFLRPGLSPTSPPRRSAKSPPGLPEVPPEGPGVLRSGGTSELLPEPPEIPESLYGVLRGERGRGSISPEVTRELGDRGEGEAAGESVAGWADADLLVVPDGPSRGAEAAESSRRRLLPEILDRLLLREEVVVPGDLAERD